LEVMLSALPVIHFQPNSASDTIKLILYYFAEFTFLWYCDSLYWYSRGSSCVKDWILYNIKGMASYPATACGGIQYLFYSCSTFII